MTVSVLRPSFYSPAPRLSDAEDLWADYQAFLADRNGRLDVVDGFERREAAVAALSTAQPRYGGRIDAARFQRNYEAFDGAGLSEAELALLAFVKMNAGEAYGVEVTRNARARLTERAEPVFQVEKLLSHEEDFHTRILLSATGHFDGVTVAGPWRPPWPLRVLIFAIATAPAALFHPILLASEISGVFTFNWMLNRLARAFPDDPAVREAMEARLIEVLVDEVGHIAYNRIACGALGIRVARPLAAAVNRGVRTIVPEIEALGLDRQARRTIASFDLQSLPEEVRRRAWFV